MSNGKSFNYKFGPKNNWRRRVWNEIKARLSVPARDAIVLYLAGEKDLDRPIAISKGFSPHNLIAIDRDKEVIKKIKSPVAMFGMDGDFFDIVESWRGHSFIHAIHADLCCGITSQVYRFVMRIPLMNQLNNCVISINLMRGRDSMLNDIREILKRDTPSIEAEKHRGKFAHILYWCGHELFLRGEEVDAKPDKLVDEALELLAKKTNQEFMSYKSDSGQVFDSVVFKSISTLGLMAAHMSEHSRTNNAHALPSVVDFVKDCEDIKALGGCDLNNPTSRRILALRATRTRTVGSFAGN